MGLREREIKKEIEKKGNIKDEYIQSVLFR